MITTWGTQYRCDRCGKESPVFPNMDAVKQSDWMHFSAPLIRPDGLVYSDLGPECLALPFAELMRSPDGNGH